MGTKLSSGQLEITDTDLILYQKGKQPVKWPLKYLKRYGFEVSKDIYYELPKVKTQISKSNSYETFLYSF